MKVRFLQDCELKDHNGIVVESFSAGLVVDLSPDKARRWVRRAKAEEVSDDTPVYAAPPAEETTPEEIAPEDPDMGESETGSEAGKEQQSPSLQAVEASQSETSNSSDAGKRRRHRRAKSRS